MKPPGRSSPRRLPRFFWPGVAILLPVAALAVAGIALLAKDRALVEEEARQRAQASLNLLVPAVNESLGAALEELEQAHLAWFDQRAIQFSSWPDGEAAGTSLRESVPADPAALMARWHARHPEFQPADLLPLRLPIPAVEATLTANPRPEVPTPPAWFAELTPAARLLWEQIRAEATARTNEARIEAAHSAFLQATTNAEARLNAAVFHWLGRRPATPAPGWARELRALVDRDPGALTESGLPLQAVALAGALRAASSASLEPELHAWLAEDVLARPSLLTPALLDAYEAAARTSPPAAQLLPLVAGLRELWQAEERARDRLAGLRRAGISPDTDTFTNAWFEEAGEFWLALGSTTTHHVSAEPAREIRFLSRRYLQAAVTRSLREDAGVAHQPGYVGIEVSVAGEPILTATRSTTSTTEPVALAQRETPLTRLVPGHTQTVREGTSAPRDPGLTPLPGQPHFAVSLVLARPELLYAQHRRRVWWFGSLILAAAGVAVAGFALTRRAYLRQVRLNELKSNFVSSVSHELRAPIASVRLLAEGLERGAVREETKRAEYFRLIVQECRRLSSLIENILDFSRIEQDRKQYEFEPTDLGELTRQTVRLMTPYAAERQVAIKAACNGGLVVIEADGKAVQQALVNLVDNAVKHSPAGATVVVGLESNHPAGKPGASAGASSGAGQIALWVKDQGPGIPAAEQHRIFEPFYRLGSELRRETQGVGIGLSIVQHIVAAHHGTVAVASEAGEGSCFTMRLPVVQATTPRKSPHGPRTDH